MKNLRLKAARAAKDLSQEALAQLVGVSRQRKGGLQPHHPPVHRHLPRAGQNTG